MEIQTIASGSTGNAYIVSSGRSKLLIECGINFDIIRKALDFDLSDVSGCLISHEHGDHTAGVKKMLRTSNIKIYASEGTISALNISDSQHIHFKRKASSKRRRLDSITLQNRTRRKRAFRFYDST
ncbi:MBL fold metallo-hydrolase [Listeria seeligeri]|uniref:MBL fold metallo-hydrolase n=1 Tax=Listeria seeligeri TaxID=1640 RepID=UPI0021AB7B5A|nr:MBL fold metallo-hydrolase [Listeria seeligeri]